MTSPQFQKLYAQLKSQPDQAAQSIEALRASHAARSEGEVLPPDVRLTPVDAGGVPAEWSDMPGSDPARVLLFFHGGAYFRGSIATVREVTARIARAAGARALSVGYRLAPEHPFPAAIEDAETAYRWLLAQGVSPRNVAVAGASAGGGVAMALLLAAREGGLPLPAAAVGLSPWVDLTQSGESFRSNAAADPTISKPYLDRFAALYLDGADPHQPLASPVFADLAGLPPLLVQVGGAETMLDESRRLVARARAAGVAAEVEVWPEMTHVWQGRGAHIPEAVQATDRIGAFLRGVWGGQG